MFILNALLTACLGAYVGKFMAMTVYYLPMILFEGCDKGREPRDIFKWFFLKSDCGHCGLPLTWLENFPIIGSIVSKGHCPHCKHPFGKQRLFLESSTALMFGLSALFFPLTPPLLFVLFVSCLLICCFITDFEHGILPDQFTISLIWVGLIGSLTQFSSPRKRLFLEPLLAMHFFG